MEFFESVQGYIAVECPVCGTRLYFRPEQQGERIVCDMCHEGLDIPKEVKLKPKPKPVRHRVEGYEVREEEPPAGAKASNPDDESKVRVKPYDLTKADEPQPGDGDSTAERTKQSEKEKRAKRRKDILLVECSLCYNRMYPRVDQVGEEIACPDCGTVMVVPEPPPRRERKPLPKPKPVEVSDEEPPERKYDHRLDRAQARPAETNLPDPPEWIFFSGVVSFIWRGQGLLYWAVLTFAILLTEILAALGYALYTADGVAAGAIPIVITWIVIAGIWVFSYGAACFFAIMQDTANGGDEITSWPEGTIADRLGDLGRLVFQLSLACSLGFGIGQLAALWLGPLAVPIGTLLGMFTLFPFLTMSSLVMQRSFAPFSATVFSSLSSLWWGWLLVYLETGLLLSVWLLSVVFTAAQWPFLTAMWSAALLAAVAMVSARLYGRLLWRATAQEYETDKDLRLREEQRRDGCAT